MKINSEGQIPTLPSFASNQEGTAFDHLTELLQKTPLPDKDLIGNLGLFIPRPSLSRILFMNELYVKALGIHGAVMEFGVRWGQNLALLSTLRNIYEPHNYNRKIIGFDTFEGFTGVSSQDGTARSVQTGGYGVTEGYESYLEDVLATHEQLAPRSHIRRFELVKGDVTQTVPQYLERHPETVVALAYFDMDLYKPTKDVLLSIKDRLTKGSIIGFDEVGVAEFPGETLALKETFGLSRYSLHRSPLSYHQSYIVYE